MTTLAPKIFLPFQTNYVQDRSHRVRVMEKSRRIGMSWALAADCVLDAAVANGVNVYYVNYNKEGSQTFIADCAFWALHFGIYGRRQEREEETNDPDVKVLTYSLKFPSGRSITALSSRAANLRGKKGRIVIDEAAFHQDLDGLWAAAAGVLQWRRPRDRVDIVSTHNGLDNPFNLIIEEVRAGKKPGWSLHRATFADAIADGYFKRVCLMNGTQWSLEEQKRYIADTESDYRGNYEEELYCVPSQSGGTYFQMDTIDAAMRARDGATGEVLRLGLGNDFKHWRAELREQYVANWLKENVGPLIDQVVTKLPRGTPFCYGQDFGRKADRSVMVPAAMLQNRMRWVPFVIELLNVPYDQQRQIMEWLLDRLPNLYAAAFDSNGNGGALAEYAAQRYGAFDPKTTHGIVEEVHITGQWYDVNFPLLRAGFEDKMLACPEDRDHMSDFMAVKREKGQPRIPDSKNESTEGPPRHGDAAVAYCAMWSASRRPIPTYGYQSAKKDTADEATQRGLRKRSARDEHERSLLRGKSTGGIF